MAAGRNAPTTQPHLNNGTIGLSTGTIAWPFKLMTLNAMGLMSQATATDHGEKRSATISETISPAR